MDYNDFFDNFTVEQLNQLYDMFDNSIHDMKEGLKILDSIGEVTDKKEKELMKIDVKKYTGRWKNDN